MPVKSPEAIARKKQRKNERNQRAAAERRTAAVKNMDLALSAHKISARRMMPKIGDLSKSDLRAMLAAAVINTGGRCAD